MDPTLYMDKLNELDEGLKQEVTSMDVMNQLQSVKDEEMAEKECVAGCLVTSRAASLSRMSLLLGVDVSTQNVRCGCICSGGRSRHQASQCQVAGARRSSARAVRRAP
jgi:hypothetical protein